MKGIGVGGTYKAKHKEIGRSPHAANKEIR